MKKLLVLFIVALISFQIADAQRKKSSFFTDETPDDKGWWKGDVHVGPVVGIGWGPAIGVDGEYAITDKKWLAFGAGANLAYHTGYSYTWYSETAVTFAVYASWHLFPHKAFDVFVKLGFGYWNWSQSWSDPYYQNYGSGWSTSSIGTIEEIAIRWYLTQNIALRAHVGSPIWLGIGADFKF